MGAAKSPKLTLNSVITFIEDTSDERRAVMIDEEGDLVFKEGNDVGFVVYKDELSEFLEKLHQVASDS